MEGFKKRIGVIGVALGVALTLALSTGCSTPATESDDAGSEFSSFDDSAVTTAESSSEDSLESEMNEAQGAPQQQAQTEPEPEPTPTEASTEAQSDEFAAFEQNAEAAPTPAPEEIPPPVVAVEPEPAPLPPAVVETPAPVPPAPVQASTDRVTQIQRILFKSNDGGGTIAIEGDGPMSFTTRTNVNTNQYVIEIPNSKLSRRARRSLNTRDFPGSIGSIDPYQAPGSTTSRIVIQMRSAGVEPVVQAEGHALLVMAATTSMAMSPPIPPTDSAATPELEDRGVVEISQESKLLSSASLDEFLANNQQFYGKKISIEANGADVREIIKFISEESGVNLVLSEDVTGKLSIKLKQVPWDQALVVVMRSKNLGYLRQGQILRIAKADDLKKEEADFLKIAKAKEDTLPLVVRMIPVSYAVPSQLVTQVQPFLSSRGKIVAEPRTSALVISDVEESIQKAQKLIASLDTAPPQVLIEGKIVEARETFSRFLGLNWQTSGESIDLGNNSKGGRQTGNFTQMSSNVAGRGGNGTVQFTLGTLDLLGNLTATLALGELKGEVRVLSSPRILTLHNEAAEISQNSQIPIVAISSDPVNGTRTTVNFRDIRLRLGVTPQVTNDASVILAVDVNRDFLGDVAEQSTGTRSINQRAAKTKVIVRNGQTAVIGGIYQVDSSLGETRIPFLADVPVLGWLFKSKNTTKEKNELMIFLTPRIVAQADSGISAPIPLGAGSSNPPSLSPESPGTAPSVKSSEAPANSSETSPSDGGLEL
jgi:type IV pilus assembly protein PilQ